MVGGQMKGSNHIVYVARYMGTVMYVGEGKKFRERHLTSGISHLYEANKYHFMGLVLDVQIVHTGITKTRAKELEESLIKKLNPVWNHRYANCEYMRFVNKREKGIRRVLEDNPLTVRNQELFLFWVLKKLNVEGFTYITPRELLTIPDYTGDTKLLSELKKEHKYLTKLKRFLVSYPIQGSKLYKVVLNPKFNPTEPLLLKEEV